MKPEFDGCEFEAEVLGAVLQSRWPDGADTGLREHVAQCAVCSDVATVAMAIDEAREGMRQCAAVPDAGRVWWLAQLRARREAAKTAGRPITVAQVLGFACAMGLLGACFGATSTWFQAALRWAGASLAALPSTSTLLTEHATLAVGMAALIFLVPAALYLAMRRD